MLYLLLPAVLVFVALTAPIETTLSLVINLVIVVLVTQVLTSALTKTKTSFADALKAFGLSVFFLIIASLAVESAGKSSFKVAFTGLGASGDLLAIGILLGSYIAGFAIALGVRFSIATIVALAASFTSFVLGQVLPF